MTTWPGCGPATLPGATACADLAAVLLHGFPEFWYGWREQIAPLVKAGFRVVAPDLRGYNQSSAPEGFSEYTADKLAADVRGLIRELGADSARVVGHDWGGTVAWTLAMNHPAERVNELLVDFLAPGSVEGRESIA